jgi:hypothetical protein
MRCRFPPWLLQGFAVNVWLTSIESDGLCGGWDSPSFPPRHAKHLWCRDRCRGGRSGSIVQVGEWILHYNSLPTSSFISLHYDDLSAVGCCRLVVDNGVGAYKVCIYDGAQNGGGCLFIESRTANVASWWPFWHRCHKMYQCLSYCPDSSIATRGCVRPFLNRGGKNLICMVWSSYNLRNSNLIIQKICKFFNGVGRESSLQ